MPPLFIQHFKNLALTTRYPSAYRNISNQTRFYLLNFTTRFYTAVTHLFLTICTPNMFFGK
jgi:hypothetical protein